MKYLRYILTAVFVGLIFYFIGKNLYVNWGQLSALDVRWDIKYLVLSLVVLLIAWLISVNIFKYIFSLLGHEISYVNVFIIYFRSMGGRYIPGKFWQLAASAYFTSRIGVSEAAGFTTFLVGQVYSMIAVLITFAIMFFSGAFKLPELLLSGLKWPAALMVIILVAFALYPKLIEKPLNTVLSYLKRDPIKMNISVGKGISLTLYFIFNWFVFGFAFWLFTNSFIYTPLVKFIGLSVILSTSVILGYLAVLVPGGLGVREGAIVLLLNSFGGYPIPLPSVMAIGFRIVITISEIILSVFAWLKKSKNA